MDSSKALFSRKIGKNITRGLFSWGLLFFCVVLASCDSDSNGTGKSTGKMRLNLSADTTSIHKGAVSNTTKAAVSDEFAAFLNTEDYRVLIMQEKDTIKAFERYDAMPSEVVLPEGTYSLIASKGQNLPAAFENPYFEGSSTFTIKADMETPMPVVCSLGNARVTVEYTDDFLEAYETDTVLLSTTYTAEDLKIKRGESRPAYVKVAKEGSELIVGIKLKKYSEDKVKTYWVKFGIERKQNIHLIFKTDGEALNGVGLDVILDDTLEKKDLTVEIPDFMWKPFMDPKLKNLNFESGITVFKIQSGLFEQEPKVEIDMPGGIGAMIIKYWREDEYEQDAVIYDLATDEGVTFAKEKYFSWSSGGAGDINLSKKKKALLELRGGINSLVAPDDENGAYTYYFKIYGSDASVKAKETNTLTFKVEVQPSAAPLITSLKGEDVSDVVEGDGLASDWELSFVATGLIDQEATKVVVNGEEFPFMTDGGAALKSAYGATVNIESSAKLILTFPKAFASKLVAPETGGSKAYTFKFYLKDLKGKENTLQKSVTVNAPEFEVITTAGDAFARRIVLRALMPKGQRERLSFQYKNAAGGTWLDVNGSVKQDEGAHYVDTIKGLVESRKYSVRALYRGIRTWVSNAVEVTTEIPGALPNAEFEDWSIAMDANGNTDEGYNGLIAGLGGLGQKIPYPYRCWEVWQPWKDGTMGWNTLNVLTTSKGGLHDGFASTSSKVWTRYHANSGTIKSLGKYGNGALIRTVGWGDGNTATVDGKLGTVDETTPGELFLGTYNSGAKYGIDFDSRPSGFTFDYKYTRKNSDMFIAEIVVLDESGHEIGRAKLGAIESLPTNDWSNRKVVISYNGEYKQSKAAKMYIRFASGTSDSKNDLMIFPSASNLSNGEYVGSQLYIDNVELVYE